MLDPAIQATFESCLDAIRRGDIPAFERCFQEEAEGYASLAGILDGSGGFRGALQALKERLPGLRLEPIRIYGEGPEIAARMRFLHGERTTEGILAFRFNPGGKIERLLLLLEPADLLPVAPGRLDPAVKTIVENYFRTYNEDDEEAHVAWASPRLVYFGAVSRITADGLATARGIFRGAHDRMGLKRLEIIRIIGTFPHLAVMVRIHGKGPGGPTEEGVWVFRLDEDNRFDRVSVLWNPGTFLTWDHR